MAEGAGPLSFAPLPLLCASKTLEMVTLGFSRSRNPNITFILLDCNVVMVIWEPMHLHTVLTCMHAHIKIRMVSLCIHVYIPTMQLFTKYHELWSRIEIAVEQSLILSGNIVFGLYVLTTSSQICNCLWNQTPLSLAFIWVFICAKRVRFD